MKDDNLSPERDKGDINLNLGRNKTVLSSVLDVLCLQAEGHTAHTGSAPPQSPAACSQSAATPAVTKQELNHMKAKYPLEQTVTIKRQTDL